MGHLQANSRAICASSSGVSATAPTGMVEGS
jgi:hypothetical protein